MLAPEHWPQIPDEWQEINAQLDARLAASPILAADFFTPQQQRFIGIASEDTVPTSTSQTVFLSEKTIKTHLNHATIRFRESQPDLNDKLASNGRKIRIEQHRLAYVCLDNGIVPVGDEMDPVGLTPEEALVLKALAASEETVTAMRRAQAGQWAFRYRLARLKEKMQASTRAGVIGSSYRMRLFVPRTVIQVPDESEAASS